MNHILNSLIERYPLLSSDSDDIYAAYSLLEQCFANGKKLLLAGNGGSAADCEHIAGELMKGFKKMRKLDASAVADLINVDRELGAQLADKLQGALPCISLTNHSALNTAYINDVDGHMFFAQQVNAYGNKNDTILCLSTSGNSLNVLYAAIVAKARGLRVISITGERGGKLADLSDVCIKIPETETYKVQELTLPIYHCICLMLEDRFFE